MSKEKALYSSIALLVAYKRSVPVGLTSQNECKHKDVPAQPTKIFPLSENMRYVLVTVVKLSKSTAALGYDAFRV